MHSRPSHRLAWAIAAIAACASLPLGCSVAVEDRGTFVVECFTRSDETLLRARPKLVAGKYARMHNDAYAFFRGSVPLYVRDTLDARDGLGASRFAVTSPRVPSIGDAHPENFGTLHAYAGGTSFDGELSLEPNDFDSAERLPYLVDVRRLAIGVAFAARTALRASVGEVRTSDLEGIAAAAVRGYGVAMLARAQGQAGPPLDWSTPVLADLAKRSNRDAGKGKELAELTVVEGGARRIRRGGIDPDQAWQVYGEVPRSVAEDLPRLLRAYAAVLPLALPEGFLVAKDIVREYGSGVASWPRIRLVVLVEGPSSAVDDDVLLEVKELADTSWPASFAPFVSATSNAERVSRNARAAFSSKAVEPLWQAVAWKGLEWQVRRETEGNKTIRVARLTGALATPEALAGLGAALGVTLARVHYGTNGDSPEARAVAAVVAPDLEGFVAEQVALGLARSVAVEADRLAFQQALRTLGPTLGFPIATPDALPSDLRVLVGEPPSTEQLQ